MAGVEGASAPSSPAEIKRARKATYMRGYYARNKDKAKALVRRRKIASQDFIEQYKKDHPCVRCGEIDYRCLTFHHLRDKKHNVSQMPSSGFRLETILKEIAKCEVLCANCHAREHYRRPNVEKSTK